jgi:hypothetical protein
MIAAEHLKLPVENSQIKVARLTEPSLRTHHVRNVEVEQQRLLVVPIELARPWRLNRELPAGCQQGGERQAECRASVRASRVDDINEIVQFYFCMGPALNEVRRRREREQAPRTLCHSAVSNLGAIVANFTTAVLVIVPYNGYV